MTPDEERTAKLKACSDRMFALGGQAVGYLKGMQENGDLPEYMHVFTTVLFQEWDATIAESKAL